MGGKERGGADEGQRRPEEEEKKIEASAVQFSPLGP